MSKQVTQRVTLFAVASSPRVQRELSLDECLGAVSRHLAGDWGDVSPGQELENNRNVELKRGRLLSVYSSQQEEAFWVFTEEDRGLVVVLFPEEYEDYLEFVRRNTELSSPTE